MNRASTPRPTPPLYSHDNPRDAPPRRAILVGLAVGGQPGFLVEEHLDELAELAATAGVEVVERAAQHRRAPDAATFIGRGKADRKSVV